MSTPDPALRPPRPVSGPHRLPRTPRRSPVWSALTMALLGLGLLTACSDGNMNVQVTSLATEDSPLYDHAAAYLTSHAYFEDVNATLDCPTNSDGTTGTACLLRLEGLDGVYDGESRSLILYVATGAQPLPGPVDLAATRQEAYGKEPVNWATTEEVNPDDPAKRYSYTCQYDSGSLYLFDAPVVGSTVSGQLDDLRVSCLTQLNPTETVPASLTGTFAITVKAAGF